MKEIHIQMYQPLWDKDSFILQIGTNITRLEGTGQKGDSLKFDGGGRGQE